MPFILPPPPSISTPSFQLIRGITTTLKISDIAQKKADQLAKQNKKVLLFDGLLGLSNTFKTHTSSRKIFDYLSGYLPLSELITIQDGFDVISGLSTKNLNAQPSLRIKQIKQDLIQLGNHYDYVLITHPYNIVHSLFEDIKDEYWIISSNHKVILETLNKAQSSFAKFILNEEISSQQFGELYLFLKTLAPQSKLERYTSE